MVEFAGHVGRTLQMLTGNGLRPGVDYVAIRRQLFEYVVTECWN